MKKNIAYEIQGDGFPIIFIHGVGSRKHSWNAVINNLKDNYLCVTYDLRGHGDSILPGDNNFIMDDLVNDVEELRSLLKLQKTHLIGHSLGGQIGPAYTLKFPTRVKTLTMLSTAAFRTKEQKQRTLDLIEEMKKKGIDAVITNLISRWYTEEFATSNPDIVSERITMLKEMNIETFLRVFWIYATYTMEDWLSKINVPTLLITGENDLACNPILNKKMSDSIKGSKLEILKNLKHSITTEAPDLLGSKIKKFLNSY